MDEMKQLLHLMSKYKSRIGITRLIFEDESNTKQLGIEGPIREVYKVFSYDDRRKILVIFKDFKEED